MVRTPIIPSHLTLSWEETEEQRKVESEKFLLSASATLEASTKMEIKCNDLKSKLQQLLSRQIQRLQLSFMQLEQMIEDQKNGMISEMNQVFLRSTQKIEEFVSNIGLIKKELSESASDTRSNLDNIIKKMDTKHFQDIIIYYYKRIMEVNEMLKREAFECEFKETELILSQESLEKISKLIKGSMRSNLSIVDGFSKEIDQMIIEKTKGGGERGHILVPLDETPMFQEVSSSSATMEEQFEFVGEDSRQELYKISDLLKTRETSAMHHVNLENSLNLNVSRRGLNMAQMDHPQSTETSSYQGSPLNSGIHEKLESLPDVSVFPSNQTIIMNSSQANQQISKAEIKKIQGKSIAGTDMGIGQTKNKGFPFALNTPNRNKHHDQTKSRCSSTQYGTTAQNGQSPSPSPTVYKHILNSKHSQSPTVTGGELIKKHQLSSFNANICESHDPLSLTKSQQPLNAQTVYGNKGLLVKGVATGNGVMQPLAGLAGVFKKEITTRVRSQTQVGFDGGIIPLKKSPNGKKAPMKV